MKHINAALFVPHEGCPHQCAFCNQVSISGQSQKLTPEDIQKTATIVAKSGCKNAELAFFGGSFTAIERKYMLSLLNAAKPFLNNTPFSGIRISTRPDAIDDEILAILKEYQVTAIELGAQSMNDNVLSLNHRGHTALDTVKAAKKIRTAGFALGLQMMTGLYGDSDLGAIKTARKLIALKPDTVRIYPTIVLKGSFLATLYENGQYQPQTLEEAVTLCSQLLLLFHQTNIPVIRLGLHSGGNVDEGYLAGAYHPAFRELCENKIYLQKAIETLNKENNPNKNSTIYVAPDAISKMIGQGKQNISALAQMGYLCKVKPLNGLDKYEIKIQFI